MKVLGVALMVCAACAPSSSTSRTKVQTLVVPASPDASLIVRNDCVDPRDLKRPASGNVAIDFGRSGSALQDGASGAWFASSAKYLRYYDCPDTARARLEVLR